MLVLAKDKQGALALAQLCDGYGAMSGGDKIRLIVTASIVLKMFLQQHTMDCATGADNVSLKRKAEAEPEENPEPGSAADQEGDPPAAADDSPRSVACL